MKPLRKNIFLGKYTILVLSVLLFVLSFVFNKLYSDQSSVKLEVSRAESYLREHQSDFSSFLKDTQRIRHLMKRKETLKEFDHITSRPYGIFLFSINEFGDITMNFWSDHLVVPDDDMVSMQDGEYFQKLSNGWYYVLKETLENIQSSERVVALALVPVRSEFFIETDYLQEKFVYSDMADKRVELNEGPTNYPVKTPLGKSLFYLEKKKIGAVPYNDDLTIFLRFGGVLLFLVFIHLLAETIARQKNVWAGIGFLLLTLFALRFISYQYPQILNLRQFDFFDPQIYGSNAIQRSLGDLLINAALFCWIVLFTRAKLRRYKDPLSGLPVWLKWFAGILSLCLLIYSTFVLATVIRSLIADSKISFDVTNFFSLDQYTVAGFALLACLSLTYYYFSQILYRFILPLFANRSIPIYFFIGTVGLFYLTYLTFQSNNPDVLFYLPVLLWLLGYTWLVNRSGLLFRNIRINITGTLTWIFIFSVSVSAIMFTEIRKAEWEKRERMAEKLAVRTDPGSERMMSIAIKYLDNDFFTDNFYRFRDPDDGKYVRDSIIADNYAGYLNKYDTRIYVYDSSGRSLNNEDATSYESLNTILNVQSKQTSIEGLYYYESDFDKFNYITRRNVFDTSGIKAGYFFIVSNPKNFSSEALLPELFRQNKGTDPESSPIYSIAVYNDRRLVSPPGNYPFATWLTDEEVPKEELLQKTNDTFDELWYRADSKKVVVIARKKETIIETITLFSYIFCAFLVLVGLVQLMNFILRSVYDWKSVKRLLQLNIRSQVHTTIIFISILSFVIIGIATISFFISRYHRNNSDKLSRTMKIMVNEMEKKMTDHSTFDDVIKVYDSVSISGLQGLVNEVSDIHGVDVNVYDLDGNLKVSSEANVYTKGVLSKKIDPSAFYHLSRLRQVQHSQEEEIGNFSYLSIYSPVRNDEGFVYAYINIPYFTSKPELEQEISNFLVTIINLNAFIFLVAGLIALFITNRITRSFSVISDKMKEVNLGKRNEAIEWNRDDEIGELVTEYNKMVSKLEESASALARSEREGAWREMARQVAHEIKNPLTPMKLSLQYLQKAIDNNQGNVKELSSNVANTLVEQIDHLSKIAADFSQFANIGNTNVEQFDLHEVIASLKELFEPNENVKIDWRPIHNKIMVEADKTQMNRLFTNLLTNAVEACSENGECKIQINERRNGNTVLISIKDNGEGILPEMRSRIFVPNFTTKSSGTGLGLAMCKGIVEQAKGKIWFETGEGEGSIFHVSLPVLN